MIYKKRVLGRLVTPKLIKSCDPMATVNLRVAQHQALKMKYVLWQCLKELEDLHQAHFHRNLNEMPHGPSSRKNK